MLINLGPNSFDPSANIIDFDEADLALGTENPTFSFTGVPNLGDISVSFGTHFVGQTTTGTGVITLDDTIPSGPLTLDPSSAPVFTANDNAADTNPILTGTPLFNGPIAIDFSRPVAAVGLTGGYFDAIESTTIEAYDINGVSLGSLENSKEGFEFYGLTTESGENLIAGLSFYITGDEPAGFEIDNVSFGASDVIVATRPNAVNDIAETDIDTPVTIAVLENDSDPEDDPISVTSVTDADNGTVSINDDDASILYTPAAGFQGEDRFVYTIQDDSGNEDTAAVTITVGGSALPIAEDDEASTSRDTPVEIDILANDSDPDGDPLTIANVSDAVNGTLTLTDDDRVLYVPNEGYIGPDQFSYEIADGTGHSSEATVTIAVIPTSTEPDAFYVLTEQTPDEFFIAEGLSASILGDTVGKTFNIPHGAAARGLDAGSIVNLEGDSDDYLLSRNGTTLEVLDANGSLVTSISASTTTDSFLRFGDGEVRVAVEGIQIATGGVIFDDGESIPGIVLVTDGRINSDGVFTGPSGLPESTDRNAYLTLTNQTPDDITFGDGLVLELLGNTAGKHLNIPSGAGAVNIAPATTVNFEGSISTYWFTRNGTKLEVRDAEGNLAATLNASTTETSTLIFADGFIEMSVSGAQIALGDTVLTDEQTLPGAQFTVDLDPGMTSVHIFGVDLDFLGGTETTPAAADAGGDAFTFIDNIASTSNTEISNFGADDTLDFIGVAEDAISVQVANGDTTFTFDSGQGDVSQITLLEVSGTFTSVAEFNADPNLGDVITEADDGVTTGEVNLDLLGGTNVAPASTDAADSAIRFTDSVAIQSISEIDNFSIDDELQLQGVSAGDVAVSVEDNNTIFSFDNGAGVNSVITLVGVNGFFTSVADFNASPNFGEVSFA